MKGTKKKKRARKQKRETIKSKVKPSNKAREFWADKEKWGNPAFLVERLMHGWHPQAKQDMTDEINRLFNGVGDVVEQLNEGQNNPDSRRAIFREMEAFKQRINRSSKDGHGNQQPERPVVSEDDEKRSDG